MQKAMQAAPGGAVDDLSKFRRQYANLRAENQYRRPHHPHPNHSARHGYFQRTTCGHKPVTRAAWQEDLAGESIWRHIELKRHRGTRQGGCSRKLTPCRKEVASTMTSQRGIARNAQSAAIFEPYQSEETQRGLQSKKDEIEGR